MKSPDEIENKVAKSGLITLDLSEFLIRAHVEEIDLKEHLWEGLVLKEKDFRNYIDSEDWSRFEGSVVSVYCSSDAIIPNWAYMLIASRLEGRASSIYYGSPQDFKRSILLKRIEETDWSNYKGERVIIKGCADKIIDYRAFGLISEKLSPFVKSLMYGEPCSTVPIMKNQNA